ncbi:hypothetical protein EKK58_02480 [Candidatus Dependentiae bacterium]|nr:MAG: hypothetical protein EKK58_02480 [Candidatus Dependentiae bacterium]
MHIKKIFFYSIIYGITHLSQTCVIEQIPEEIILRYIFKHNYTENCAIFANQFKQYCFDNTKQYIIHAPSLALTCKHFYTIFEKYYYELADFYLEKYFLINFLFCPEFTFDSYTKTTELFTDFNRNTQHTLNLKKMLDSGIKYCFDYVDNIPKVYKAVLNRISKINDTLTLDNLKSFDYNTYIHINTMIDYYHNMPFFEKKNNSITIECLKTICNIFIEEERSLFFSEMNTASSNHPRKNLFSILFTSLAYLDFDIYKQCLINELNIPYNTNIDEDIYLPEDNIFCDPTYYVFLH